ncbi:hypothetical protein [Sodalis praecaptivus]|nr:hypothetical protein [Sodalis praecaptivus]
MKLSLEKRVLSLRIEKQVKLMVLLRVSSTALDNVQFFMLDMLGSLVIFRERRAVMRWARLLSASRQFHLFYITYLSIILRWRGVKYSTSAANPVFRYLSQGEKTVKIRLFFLSKKRVNLGFFRPIVTAVYLLNWNRRIN